MKILTQEYKYITKIIFQLEVKYNYDRIEDSVAIILKNTKLPKVVRRSSTSSKMLMVAKVFLR
jgi:hypothetical protein